MILGTYRPTDAVIYSQSLRDTVWELNGRGLCQELLLELLTEADLANYLVGRLNSEASNDLIEGLYRRSGGNPLFMVNLLEELIRTQVLVFHNGLWSVGNQAEVLDTDMPESLRSLITRQLEALPQAHREMLEIGSVVGMEFSAAAMTDALPKTVEEIESACEKLSADGQFTESGNLLTWPDGTLTGSYRFQHHLYLEVIYRQINAARRARIHRKVGQRLEAGYGERAPEIAANLASHFDLGNDPERALCYCRMAGERALGLHAYREASQHLQSALEAFDQVRSRPADGDLKDPVRWELEVCTALGTALIVTRGHGDPEVEKVHSRARTLIERVDDPLSQFPTLFNLWTFSVAAADLAESAKLVTRMSELVAKAKNDELALMFHCARLRTAFFRGEFAESADSVRQLLTLYDPLLHSDLPSRYCQDEPGVIGLGVDAWRLWLQGQPDQAATQAREACKLGESLDSSYGKAFAWAWSLATLQFRGETAQLARRAEDLRRLSTERGFSVWIAWATFFEGWAAGARADEADGIALMERGLDAWYAAGTRIGEPYFLALLSERCLCAGRIDAAGERLAEARDQVEKSGERWWEAELHRLQGEVLLAAGDGDRDRGDRAEACFRRALEVASRQGATSLELRAALSLSRFGNSPDAHQLLGEVVGRFTEGHDTADLRAAQAQLSLIHPDGEKGDDSAQIPAGIG
jgi:adenylate cyclase